jgi:hypothetical protein
MSMIKIIDNGIAPIDLELTSMPMTILLLDGKNVVSFSMPLNEAADMARKILNIAEPKPSNKDALWRYKPLKNVTFPRQDTAPKQLPEKSRRDTFDEDLAALEDRELPWFMRKEDPDTGIFNSPP